MIFRRMLLAILAVILIACGEQKPTETTTQNSRPTSYSIANKKAKVITTADSTDLRMAATDMLSFGPHGQPVETETVVFVDPTHTFQTFLGIGGAITDASAETFAKLPADKQDEILKAYYDPNDGIGYTLARTNIHSCDFSSGSYTYVDDGDKELKSFDISHDKEFRIPLIKKAMEHASEFTLFASPWSPPAWMKSNKDMLHGGKLLPEFRQSWADYFAKFIKAYESEGIPVWGVTVQNEPMATQIWESCIFTAEEERDFVKEFLGPTLESSGLGDKKIIAWDHNRDLIYQRAATMLDDPDAAKYVWGIGFHWYEDWTGGKQMFENVARVNNTWKETNLIFTEGCNGAFNANGYDGWWQGERYGESMINDFNAGAVGWTDWNILLDETGGPNHVSNFNFAPIHGMTNTGELIYTNSYYYIGHFSKFIRRGAKRVQAAPSRSNLLATAFLNPDGSLVVVTMNKSNSDISYLVWIDGQAVKTVAPPHSISTYIIE